MIKRFNDFYNQLDNISQQILKTVSILISIATVVLIINLVAFKVTLKEVRANERYHLLESLKLMSGGIRYDNDLLKSKQIVDGRVQYQACDGDEVKLTIAEISTNKGYSGEIKLLVSLDDRNNLVKTYVLSHSETPGLGDQIDEKKSPWIRQFVNISFLNKIALKKDGGTIDSISGATISSRAVTNAVNDYAKYYKTRKKEMSYCESFHKNKDKHENEKHHDHSKKDKEDI